MIFFMAQVLCAAMQSALLCSAICLPFDRAKFNRLIFFDLEERISYAPAYAPTLAGTHTRMQARRHLCTHAHINARTSICTQERIVARKEARKHTFMHAPRHTHAGTNA